MKKFMSSRGLFALAFLILVAANIAALSRVVTNRSGEPESRLALTEREMQLPYFIREENNSISLQLSWRALGKDEDGNSSYWRSPEWFDAGKLRELGFTIEDTPDANANDSLHKEPIAREVFIVLEYEGAPHQEAVRRAEAAVEKAKSSLRNNEKEYDNAVKQAEERLQRERTTASRLFAVDAGLNPTALREKYGDRSRFIITKGLVKPWYHVSKDSSETTGNIVRLSVEKIYVPLELRQALDSLPNRNPSGLHDLERPRYALELAYGNHQEPWILSVQRLEKEK
jgi:hypothetical protein